MVLEVLFKNFVQIIIINIKSKLFGIPDVFIEHQSREEMIEESGLKASKIIKEIEELRLVK